MIEDFVSSISGIKGVIFLNKNAYILYEWLRTLPFAEEDKEENEIRFKTIYLQASIRMYDMEYMELVITRNPEESPIFYQQFEIHDLKTARKMIWVFIYALANPQILTSDGRNSWGDTADGKTEEEDTADRIVILSEELQKHYSSGLRILISCSSGASSSVLANKMNAFFEQTGCGITAEAADVMQLEEKEKLFDIILLAPQIAYRYRELNQICGNKIRQIDTLDFATLNVEHIIEKICA